MNLVYTGDQDPRAREHTTSPNRPRARGSTRWNFVARVLVQIPDPRRHSVRYYGFYSNATRGKRKKPPHRPSPPPQARHARQQTTQQGADRAALRHGWAEMIRRVYIPQPMASPA